MKNINPAANLHGINSSVGIGGVTCDDFKDPATDTFKGLCICGVVPICTSKRETPISFFTPEVKFLTRLRESPIQTTDRALVSFNILFYYMSKYS